MQHLRKAGNSDELEEVNEFKNLQSIILLDCKVEVKLRERKNDDRRFGLPVEKQRSARYCQSWKV